MSAGSLPKCCGFIILSASIISSNYFITFVIIPESRTVQSPPSTFNSLTKLPSSTASSQPTTTATYWASDCHDWVNVCCSWFYYNTSTAMEPQCTMSSVADILTCLICDTCTSEKLTKVTEAGLETLRNSCKIRRHDLLTYLDDHTSDIHVHNSCRKSFTRSSDMKLKLQIETPTELRTLLSVSGNFVWKTMCFLCG